MVCPLVLPEGGIRETERPDGTGPVRYRRSVSDHVDDDDGDLAARRVEMVDHDIAARGVSDPRVLDAMRAVPRHDFVPDRYRALAYTDQPLPIGRDQTISQPLMVAVMAAAAELRPNDRALEIGTGSGYGAAVLARLAATVFTVERHEELASTARQHLDTIGCDNVTVVVGDGTAGLPDLAPFDAIVVTAAAPSVPGALVDQLVDGGRLVVPVGRRRRGAQHLMRIRRLGNDVVEEDLGGVRFVPLIGEYGFRS